MLAYNAASFCWIGWDEPGIKISDPEERIGREMALQHQQLVQELSLEDIKQARAYWIVGAYDLTARNWDAARNAFENSASLAKNAINDAEELLARAFATLASKLARPEDERFALELDTIVSRLGELEGGEALAQQVRTAESVCKRPDD